MCKFCIIFAPKMKKHLLYIVLCLLSLSYAHAETILLHTGARVKGTILFQNEEVVIVRDEAGQRFQYLRTDVAEILADDAEEAEPVDIEAEPEITTSKKASILLELSCAPSIMIPFSPFGNAGIDLLAGTHHIKDRHVFIGAGVGYHGYFQDGYSYNFLPIEAKLSVPFMEAKHAPVFGIALGYGVALSKDYIGGIYTGIDFGYRYQINPKSALAVMAFASFQQARLNTTVTIEGNTYTHKAGRNFVSPGIKFALFF